VLEGLAILAFAFTAGLFVTLSPCGYALLPAFISYVAGRENRGRGVAKVLLAASLSLVAALVAIGFAVSLLGLTAASVIPGLGPAAAVTVIAMGVFVLSGRSIQLGSSRILGLSRRLRGTTAGAVFGASYAAAASSCTAPIFVAIISYAFAARSLAEGVITLSAYALGAVMPLMIAGLAAQEIAGAIFGRLTRYTRYTQPVAGVLIIAFGTYLLFNRLGML